MMLPSIRTRFRAYQLGNPGSSFSYAAGGHFTLIEARVTELSWPQLYNELVILQRSNIDTLHMTSWDADHCAPNELDFILEHLQPRLIELPGYEPHCDSARTAQFSVTVHNLTRSILEKPTAHLTSFSPQAISGLPVVPQQDQYTNLVFHPRQVVECSNDNSTIKLFRSGCFNVLSLGDVEDPAIAEYLMCFPEIRDVDVLILAHHGADNGFTTERFIRAVQPSIAIATSDYDNQFEHPRQEIRDMLYECEVRLFTTKTGDVIVESIGTHQGEFLVRNLKANSTQQSSAYKFTAKKAQPVRGIIERARLAGLGAAGIR